MKKIFTLIAVALCAMGVNAQGLYAVAEGDVITAGDKITSVENVVMTYSADGGTFVAGKKTGNWVEADFVAYTNGSNNGKFTEGSEPAGCYYKFETAVAGTLTVGVQLGGNKGFFVVNKDFAKVTDYTYMLPASKDSEESQIFTQNEKGEDIIASKTNGTVTVKAEAGGVYYVFAVGTKMGCFGFKFEAGNGGDTDGINTVVAGGTKADTSVYNLAGQKVNDAFKGVVVKNGKKLVQK